MEETIEKEYIPFVTTLRALKGVKDSCFGPKLHENWKENIQNFEKAWFDIYIEFDIYFSKNALKLGKSQDHFYSNNFKSC